MSDNPIFTDWSPRNASMWGETAQRLRHRLHEHPLFTNDALAALIEKYPREHYSLVQWGGYGKRGDWREGELGGLSGEAVVDAIAKGRVWINLRNAPIVDARYGALLEAIFAELRGYMPEFETFTRKLGILVSSPNSRTLYHADLPGQSLWQIRGRKRVYVYPTAKPFLRPEHVENIALSGVEVNMPFEPWYDEHAQVFDIEPGDMLHWRLNAPHRVDNHDCLNVSMTLEYFTDEIRRQHMVTVANGILRHRFGMAPKGQALSGPAFWAKAVLQKAMRNTSLVRKVHKPRKPTTFRLDPTRPDSIADLAPAQ